MEIMFSRSELSRAHRELMAVITSVSNGCEYCATHHGSALNHYWKDDKKIQQLKSDFRKTVLDEKENALCEYAERLTLEPGRSEEEDITLILNNVGFSDNAILDASLVVSYFNFVNRMVLSLGVHLEQDKGENYNY